MKKEDWDHMMSIFGKCNVIYNDFFSVIAATHATRKWSGNPLWVMGVAPPSYGKTIPMELLKETGDVKLVSSVTPAALISGYGGEGCDPSLFSELDGHTLLAKDFGTILSQGYIQTATIFAMFREAYDGHVSKQFGMFKREYTLKFNFVAACTDQIERYKMFAGQLGERFLYYRVKRTVVPPNNKMNPAIFPAVADFMMELDREYQNEEPSISDSIVDKVNKMAYATAILRTEVVGSSQEIIEVPRFESGSRLEKQLVKLYLGLNALGMQDDLAIEVLRHSCESCMPYRRMAVFQYLLEYEHGSTTDITDHCRLSYSMVDRTCKELHALGLLKTTSNKFPKANSWRVSDEHVGTMSMLWD